MDTEVADFLHYCRAKRRLEELTCTRRVHLFNLPANRPDSVVSRICVPHGTEPSITRTARRSKSSGNALRSDEGGAS